MKIVIGDCYHDSDKGGGGILSGALDALRAACRERGVEPQIALMFRFSADDPRFATASRHIQKTFPDLNVLPAPLSSRRGPGLFWLLWVLRVLVTWPLRLLFPAWSRHPAVRALRQADLVVFKGGHFYRSRSRHALWDFLAMLLVTYPLMLAGRLRKPWCVLSQTFGPFSTAMSRLWIGRVMKGACLIACREATSRNYLIECHLDPDLMKVIPDTAFGTHAADDRRTGEILSRHGLEIGRYLAVNARPWFHKQDDDGCQHYYRAMAALCDYAVSRHGLKVALVVQNDGMHHEHESDAPALREIHSRMQQSQAAVILEEDLSFDELAALYQHAALTLASRLHSCIFSLAGGTPAICAAYGHKGRGVMNLAGAGDFLLDMDRIDVEQGKNLIDRIVAQRPALSREISSRVAEHRKDVLQCARSIVSLVREQHATEAIPSGSGKRLAGWLDRHRNQLRWLLAVALVGAIVVFFLKNRQGLQVLRQIQPNDIALLLGLQVGTIVLYAAKLRIVLVKFLAVPLKWPRWFMIFAVGRMLNLLTSQSGNVYRALTLKARYGLSYTHYVGSFLAFAWLDTLLTFTLAAAVLLASGQKVLLWGLRAELLMVLAAVAAASGLGLSYLAVTRLHPPGRFLARVKEKLVELHHSLWRIVTDGRLMLKFVGLQVLTVGVMTAIMWTAFAALAQPVDTYKLLVLYAIYRLTLLVHLTPGNLGVAEVLVGVISNGLGIDPATAMLVSLINRLTHYVALISISGLGIVTGLIAGAGRPGWEEFSQR